jgi:hypothetical protein
MECAFPKDLSLEYKIPEPCLLSCQSDDIAAESASGHMVYIIVVSVVVIVVLAVGGFAFYYSRMIRPNLGEKETLVDRLRGRTRDGDRTVRNNVWKRTRPIVRLITSHAFLKWLGCFSSFSYVPVHLEITTRRWAAQRITPMNHRKEIVKLP